MPLARLGSQLVFFAHIPKTGGTSIETYLRTKGRLAMHHNKLENGLGCSPQHMHGAMIRALLNDGFCDHSFAVLRDPVERLKSEYRHRAKRKASRGQGIAGFDEWAPRILKLSRNKPFLFDNHIRPQAEFVLPGMRLFRFEDGLDRVFDWIDTLGGDPAPGPREWKRNLSHVEVTATPKTREIIRKFYAADQDLLATATFN